MSGRRLSLFTNNVGGVFQRSVIEGVSQTIDGTAYGLHVVERPSPSGSVLKEAQGSDGALVLANVLTASELAELAASGMPITLVSHRSTELSVPAIIHDNRQGMRQLVQHLVEAGRRRPLFVRGNLEQVDGRERESAFRDELMRHDLHVPEEHFLAGDFEPPIAVRSLTTFLARGGDFDAVVSADYLMAIPLLAALRAAGRQVPKDVSVAAYGDGPEAEAAGLTTVSADVVDLGRRAARQLLAQLGGQRIQGMTLLSTRLVARKT